MGQFRLRVGDEFLLLFWVSISLNQFSNFKVHKTLTAHGSPGNEHSRAVGAVYANASLAMLNDGPAAGNLVFNLYDTLSPAT